MKSLPADLESKIDEIHSWMFDGDLDKVAKLSGKSRTWVSQIFNKRVTPHLKVVEAGIQVMNENKRLCECLPQMKIA